MDANINSTSEYFIHIYDFSPTTIDLLIWMQMYTFIALAAPNDRKNSCKSQTTHCHIQCKFCDLDIGYHTYIYIILFIFGNFRLRFSNVRCDINRAFLKDIRSCAKKNYNTIIMNIIFMSIVCICVCVCMWVILLWRHTIWEKISIFERFLCLLLHPSPDISSIHTY